MIQALVRVWLQEDKIATTLKNIMESAYTSTPDGQIIPDFKVMLEAIKVWYKLRKKWPDLIIGIPMIFGSDTWNL